MSTHTFPDAPPSRAVAPAPPPAKAPKLPEAAEPESGPESGIGWKYLLLLAPLAALAPLLWAHAQHLWELPHYQFFPFVVLGAVVLTLSRWPSASRGAGDLRTAFGLLVAAWIVLAAGEAVYSPMLAVVALQLILAAGLFTLGGSVFFRALLPAWAFLWILVPLPFGLDRRLVFGMQQLASIASSAVLDCLGVIHVLDGNVVRIAQKPLFVEEACAGLSSLFTMVACSLFLVLWLRRSWGRALLLIAASIGWVLACNILRIVIIAFALDRGGPDWDLSSGPRHEILGFGCFCLAVLLIWSTDRFLQFFLPPGNETAPVPSPQADPEQPVVPKHVRFADLCRLASLPLAVAFGVVLVLHFAIHNFILPDAVAPVGFDERVEKIEHTALPVALEQYRKLNFAKEKRVTGSAFGEHSKMWVYGKDSQAVIISLDYPFPKFHDLSPCYVGRGWAIDNARSKSEPGNAKAPAVWSEMEMHKTGGQFGYVVYAEFNAQGDSLQGESRLLGALLRHERALQALYDRIFRPEEFNAPKPIGPAYQIQAFTMADKPIDADDRDAIREMFFLAVRELRPHLFDEKK